LVSNEIPSYLQYIFCLIPTFRWEDLKKITDNQAQKQNPDQIYPK